MKITTLGLPASVLDETCLPETASGKSKLGIGGPSARMLEGTAMRVSYRGWAASATPLRGSYFEDFVRSARLPRLRRPCVQIIQRSTLELARRNRRDDSRGWLGAVLAGAGRQ